MTACDMSSKQSLGTEKTSVENFTASSGTRTGTDAFGSDDAALKCRLEVAAQGKSVSFPKCRGDLEPVGK